MLVSLRIRVVSLGAGIQILQMKLSKNLVVLNLNGKY